MRSDKASSRTPSCANSTARWHPAGLIGAVRRGPGRNAMMPEDGIITLLQLFETPATKARQSAFYQPSDLRIASPIGPGLRIVSAKLMIGVISELALPCGNVASSRWTKLLPG